MRLKNILTTFTDYSFDDLSMNEQLFDDYKSKYLEHIAGAKPSLLQWKTTGNRIIAKIKDFFDTFINRMGGN